MSADKIAQNRIEREISGGDVLKESAEESFQDEVRLSINEEQEGFKASEILSNKSTASEQRSDGSRKMGMLTDAVQLKRIDGKKGLSLKKIKKDDSEDSILSNKSTASEQGSDGSRKMGMLTDAVQPKQTDVKKEISLKKIKKDNSEDSILTNKSTASEQKSDSGWKMTSLLTDAFQPKQTDVKKEISLKKAGKGDKEHPISVIIEDRGGPQRRESQRSEVSRKKCFMTDENKARNMLTLMLFLGMVNASFLRINLLVSLEDAVKHTKLAGLHPIECFTDKQHNQTKKATKVIPFSWTETEKKHVLNAFFYGYFITQIPSGILVHRYGSKLMLGIGMIVNTILGFLTPITASYGFYYIFMVRFVQGIGEGPVIPSCHTILANWTPPNERGRRVAIVYCGAQVGTAITLPLSKYVSTDEMIGGWASMFYILSGLSTIWLVCFYIFVYEDPLFHPKLDVHSKINILSAVWGTEVPRHRGPIPWNDIIKSPPFWGIILASVANSYSYEILMTEIPLFMTEVLNYNIKEHTLFAAMPYCFMAICALMFSISFDEIVTYQKMTIGTARKLANTFGQLGPAVALGVAGFTRCNGFLTVAVLTVGLGINGAVYCGYLANHIDISPNFVCILVTITHLFANIVGVIVPILASFMVYRHVNIATWGEVFFLTIAQYIACNLHYWVFASGKRQVWDIDVPSDSITKVERALSVYTKLRRHLLLPK